MADRPQPSAVLASVTKPPREAAEELGSRLQTTKAASRSRTSQPQPAPSTSGRLRALPEKFRRPRYQHRLLRHARAHNPSGACSIAPPRSSRRCSKGGNVVAAQSRLLGKYIIIFRHAVGFAFRACMRRARRVPPPAHCASAAATGAIECGFFRTPPRGLFNTLQVN